MIPRTHLFGGALLAAGITVPTAHAQPLIGSFERTLRADAMSIMASADDGTRAYTTFSGGIDVARFDFTVSQNTQVQFDTFGFDAPGFSTFVDTDLRLHRDDGNPPSATNLVAQNDLTPIGTDRNGSVANFDGFLDVTLTPGEYVLYIGSFFLSDAEIAAGTSDGVLFAPTGTPAPILEGRFRLDVYGSDITLTDAATVTNLNQRTTYLTLQAALDNANNLDTIELGPGTLNEDNITPRDDSDIRIIGAPFTEGLTAIDPGPSEDPDAPVFNFQVTDQTDRTLIKNIIVRNGTSPLSGAGGARFAGTASPVFENVYFFGNSGRTDDTGPAQVAVADDAAPIFRQCAFSDGFNGARQVDAADNAAPVFLECFFSAENLGLNDDNGDTAECLGVSQNASADLFFSTLVNGDVSLNAPTAGLSLVYSVIEEEIIFNSGASSSNITESRSVFHQSADPAFAVTPLFNDEPALDFSLRSGTPGVDAADLALRFTSGVESAVDVLFERPRVYDDPATVNTDDTAMDCGAFEFVAVSDERCPEDIDGSGVVGPDDLFRLLAVFGDPCPTAASP